MNMPTYERRYYLIKKQNEITEAEEERENNGGGTVSTGKHSRSTTISGSALKTKLNNNKNP